MTTNSLYINVVDGPRQHPTQVFQFSLCTHKISKKLLLVLSLLLRKQYCIMDRVNGFITIEKGNSAETSLEIVEGMQFDRGYLSKYFTDRKIMKAEFQDCKDVYKVLDFAVKGNYPVVIIAENVEKEALAPAEASTSPTRQTPYFKKLWGILVLNRSTVVFALGHTDFAYRASCRAWMKHMLDIMVPESEKKESDLITDKQAKIDNVTAKRLEELKVSNLPKDDIRNEFITPALSEDVVDPMTKVFNDDAKVKDLKQENMQGAIPDDAESANSIDDSSNPIDDDSPKVKGQQVVSPTIDVTYAETKIGPRLNFLSIYILCSFLLTLCK
ncbi:TCP-1/cpn60 chaperonin family protein [Artemisia annua]|uniref:TCP-1/cpn60 chaperonin family protein n=1 Tax=Artemisia annua TaxID=35608 RepID=A0A2U1MRZ8_ARTAN|nr:TCP-1/cpn60 chaperonin family protein [Artemisia annua]